MPDKDYVVQKLNSYIDNCLSNSKYDEVYIDKAYAVIDFVKTLMNIDDDPFIEKIEQYLQKDSMS